MAMPISKFAAGPVKEDTKHTTRSPSVQHWWHAMASNWIIHGRNCADIVPSSVGTLGLEDGRDIDVLIPLWYEFRCMSPLSPLSSSCVGHSLDRWSLPRSLASWRSWPRRSLVSWWSRMRVSLMSSWSRVRMSLASSWSRVRVSLASSWSRVRMSLMSSWSRVRVSLASSWSRMHESVLRAGSVDLSWPTEDGWKSKSGRSLDGTPVGVDGVDGVDGVYGVLAVGASRWREAVRWSWTCRSWLFQKPAALLAGIWRSAQTLSPTPWLWHPCHLTWSGWKEWDFPLWEHPL